MNHILNSADDAGLSNVANDVNITNDVHDTAHSNGANDIDLSDATNKSANKSANKRTNIQDGLDGRNVLNGLSGDGLRGSRLQEDGIDSMKREMLEIQRLAHVISTDGEEMILPGLEESDFEGTVYVPLGSGGRSIGIFCLLA